MMNTKYYYIIHYNYLVYIKNVKNDLCCKYTNQKISKKIMLIIIVINWNLYFVTIIDIEIITVNIEVLIIFIVIVKLIMKILYIWDLYLFLARIYNYLW